MNKSVMIQMNGIHKYFPGVHALNNVQFDLMSGEVHAIIGENGAGKSTLIKILGGIHNKDEGQILINGHEVEINSVHDAKKYGISIIHQELMMVSEMTVAENIFLGNEPLKKGLVDFEKMNNTAQAFLDSFDLNIKSDTIVSDLTIAQQQMVEIIKAVSFNAKILVLDEPTSSLSDKEVKKLFDTMRELRKKGIGQIYISHRMSELQEIADRVSIFRDGQYIDTKILQKTTNEELIALMVGRSISNFYTRTYNDNEEVVLEVENLNNKNIHDVSFQLKKGEILGFSGLVGAGRSETMRAIFGMDALDSGEVYLNGKKLQIKNSMDAINSGIALVPENRKEEGLFLEMSVKFNITLKVLRMFIKKLGVDFNKEDDVTNDFIKKLQIKTPDPENLVSSLSGGNQQKVVIASWLANMPRVLLLDEPTRGIDVGAKAEIYQIMNELLKEGVSIIMVSSELPEIISMSDRVVVMREGAISAVIDRHDATQELIMKHSVII